jgi:uncharacterized protein YprB with RNaseH-like and TPR domain
MYSCGATCMSTKLISTKELILEDELYRKCLLESRQYDGISPFWDDLATASGYDNSEALRSAFRRERERRNDKNLVKTFDSDKHRVVIFDIETMPLKGYVWDVWKQNILPSQLIDDWVILSWAAKDLMRGEVRGDVLTPKEALKRDDERIVDSLWEEFDDASILIGHNIVDFDVPKSNTRYLFYGKNPPSPYRTIDTLKILKYSFRMTYNRLDYVNSFLGLTQKMANDGFPLWDKCSRGDPDALEEMSMYNKQDILAEEELYLAVRAWDNRHPNIGLFFDDTKTRCKHCGSDNLKILDGHPYTTPLGTYDSLRCGNCGAVGRRAYNNDSKVKRASLLR